MLTVLGGGTPSEEPYKIERSLRFNGADSAHLSRTPIAAGNRKTWTWSGWVKRSGLGTTQYLFSANYASSQLHASLWFNTSDKLQFTGGTVGVSNDFLFETTQVFRDVSAWYMLTISVDSTQTTNTNRVKIYVNGNQVTSFSTQTYPSQNYDFSINNNVVHRVGSHTGSADFVNGYLTEVHFIDGLALGPEEFGETDPVTGVWRPKQYEAEAPPLSVQYLVIAGGGAGHGNGGGGGGAGGYRNSYSNETSGANSSTESPLSLETSTTYSVTVGAGGSGNFAGLGTSGGNSIFSTITSLGGSRGVRDTSGSVGGSGGGTSNNLTGGAGTAGQGFSGGTSPGTGRGGGGGGAGGSGANGATSGGTGGVGLSSSITGTSICRAGGGGGGSNLSGSSQSAATCGGGGGGSYSTTNNTPPGNGGHGSSNTGGGGGGGGGASGLANGLSGNGGSGVVILRYPSTYNITVSAGLTYSQSTVDSDKVVQFTSGTGTVSFS